MVGLIVVVVFVLYISIASACIILLKGKIKKIMALLIFLLIPTADVIVGNIYFNYTCSKYSGIFVHKKIGIGEEYFLKPNELDESPWIFKLDFLINDRRQKINRDKFRKRYLFKFYITEPKYSKTFHISKSKDEIIDKHTGYILSESTKFGYGGGWVENIYKMGGTNKKCPADRPNLEKLAEVTFYYKSN